MTAIDLQNELMAEMEALFSGWLFIQPRQDDAADTVMVPLNVTGQALPVLDDSTKSIPYLSVAIGRGTQDDADSPENVTVTLTFGIFNDDKDNNGHITILNMIETIRQRFFKDRLLAGKYYLVLPFDWQLNDEEAWPYFFGGIETHWNIPPILPEDPLT